MSELDDPREAIETLYHEKGHLMQSNDFQEPSPFGNELLLEFVIRAIKEEKLGQHDVPDFLGVSFPCNDSIGRIRVPFHSS